MKTKTDLINVSWFVYLCLCGIYVYIYETRDYKLLIISCMKVIHSNFAISTFAYIILSVFLSFFRDKGSHNRRKGFWIFLRLRAVSPSRRSPSCKSKKNFKILKKNWFQRAAGSSGSDTFFTYATGFVERRDYSWQKVSCHHLTIFCKSDTTKE